MMGKLQSVIMFTILIGALLVLGGCAQTAGNTGNGGTMKSIAVIETNKGVIKAELYTADAPITTANFIQLANSGFYTGLKFHRYEPGFVIQGGDPNGDGTGGSPKKIPLEISPKLTHVKGALAMARTSDPNSASSQFYIALEDANFLDGNYAVFGKVIEGMDVAGQLRQGDSMTKVIIQQQ